jgi:(4S)-4-hydroxy-5-phosphonooxypentane-2,3-dione isomerase
MSKIAIVGEFETKPGRHAEFETLIRNHAKKCLEIEPGTLRFELLHPFDEYGTRIPNRLMVSELFADQAAVEFHRSTNRMAEVAAQFATLTERARLVLAEVEG